MPDNQITLKVTLSLDENPDRHMSRDELIAYLKARLRSSMGFRGQVERFNLVGYKAKRA